MIYSQKRLKTTLRVFRNAQTADKRRAEGSQRANRHAFNKYALRVQPKGAAAQLASWQSDDSDSGDGEYDPTRKKRKKSVLDKANYAKRKVSDIGDEENGKKRSKTKATKELYLPRPSTSEELCSKYAFITLKIGSEKGKESLKRLTQERGMITCTSELEVRKWYQKEHETYEDQFNAQIEEIDNTGGRALRNGRKIPEIDVGSKRTAAPPEQNEEIGFQKPKPTAMQQQKEVDYLKVSHGLPSPAPTPPNPPEMMPAEDVITISSSPSPSPEPLQLQTIKTNFAHPIDFQYHYRPGQPPCHFCADFMYGIMGLGRERSITVSQTGTSNKFYQERGNGYRNHGKEATRMCIVCALKRMYISNCDRHQFKAVPGLNPRNPELSQEVMKAYVDQIMGHMNTTKTKTRETKGLHPTCSICCCPALYQCCTRQSKTLTGKAAECGSEEEGCGLVVCQLCEEVVSSRSGRLAYRFIRDHVEEKEARDMQRPLRADVRFLFRGSLLHQAFGNPR